MYKKVDSSMDFCSREKEIIDFWNENKIFEKSVNKKTNRVRLRERSHFYL